MSKESTKSVVAAIPGKNKSRSPYGLDIIANQASFAQWLIKRLVVMLLISVSTIPMLVTSTDYLASRKKEVHTYQVDSHGRHIKLYPVDQPFVTDSQLGGWVEDALEDLYTYSFVTHKKQLKYNQKYFDSASGYKNFTRALHEAQFLDKIIIGKRSTQVKIAGGLRIRKKWLDEEKVYHWRVELPIKVIFRKADEAPVTDSYKVSMVVKRVDRNRDTSGLMIVNLVAE